MYGELSATERRALAALDIDGLVALLCELIAIPSLDGEETELQQRVASWMDEVGLQTDVWPIDLSELARHPDWSHEIERDEALGVVAWVGQKASSVQATRSAVSGSGEPRGRDLLLNGHIDVVPVGDEAAWTTPPGSPALETAASTAVAPST